jgi:hypothetical protein
MTEKPTNQMTGSQKMTIKRNQTVKKTMILRKIPNPSVQTLVVEMMRIVMNRIVLTWKGQRSHQLPLRGVTLKVQNVKVQVKIKAKV